MIDYKTGKIEHTIKPSDCNPGTSSPYVIQYANPTDKKLKCVLFGFNHHYRDINLGSDEGIIVTNLFNSAYSHLLAQSAFEPFKSGLIHIELKSGNTEALEQCFSYYDCDADGHVYQTPIRFSPSMYDVENVAKSYKTIIIDGNRYLTFELPSRTTLQISVYPIMKIKLSLQLEENCIDITISLAWKIKQFLKGFWNKLFKPKPRLKKDFVQ